MKAHLEAVLQKACHIVLVLRHLLLNVDVEVLPEQVLPELSSSCVKANSLLDCATVLSLKAKELQQRKSLCQDVEFRLFLIQTTYHKVLSDTLTNAETIFNTTLE